MDKFYCNKIKNKITNIKMIINAGKLPSNIMLLDKKISGGRIIGEFCHFIDLSISLLKHTFYLMFIVLEEINTIKIQVIFY